MVHKERFVFIGDVHAFARMFFRARAPIDECGHMYWCAPRSALRVARGREASRQHVVISDSDGSDWETVLPLGDRRRLLKYRADQREHQLEKLALDFAVGRLSEQDLAQHIQALESEDFIFNVRNNSGEKGGTKTKAMPTLLRTSMLFSSLHKRLLLGGEKMQVQGHVL